MKDRFDASIDLLFPTSHGAPKPSKVVAQMHVFIHAASRLTPSFQPIAIKHSLQSLRSECGQDEGGLVNV